MKRIGWGLVALAVAASVAMSTGWAAETAPPSRGTDQVDELMGRYNLNLAFEKFGRGVSNTLGGWLEIPLNVHQRYAQSDTGASFFTGAVHGVFRAAVRTTVGVYETVTFFLPYPENFAPILPTLEYFQHHTKRKPLPFE